MNTLITIFKNHIKELSKSKNFPHHTWFVTYHLEVVEKIALELCDRYPKANRDLVMLLVWLHDYGKIIDYKNQYKTTLTAGKKKLLELGFKQSTIDKAILYIETIDSKKAISSSPIEVQIVSSADGASHLIGPFFSIFWKENSQWEIQDLMKENKRKALIDWEKKIVLPEIKEKYLRRHKLLLEHCGDLPKNYLT